MALSTFAEIKAQLSDELPNFANGKYPEDYLSEFADGLVPIYYGDIIAEWREMPMEFSDRWQELGTDGSATITKLMQIDLYIYYLELVNEAYFDLTTEQEND